MILILVLKISQLLSQIPKPQTIEGVQVDFWTWSLQIYSGGVLQLVREMLNIFQEIGST